MSLSQKLEDRLGGVLLVLAVIVWGVVFALLGSA